MTPVAMAVARKALLSGERGTFDAICQSQFFECSEISEAAYEMLLIEYTSHKDLNFPAPITFIELKFNSCNALINEMIELNYYKLGIMISDSQILFSHSDEFPYEYHIFMTYNNNYTDIDVIDEGIFSTFPYDGIHANSQISDSLSRTGRAYLALALRCMEIITTPRLVLTEERRSKPQRVKGVSRMIPGTTWKKVTIDPQATITPKLADAQGPSMPLHFVHGHMKPSLGRFIDGYWRGNAALGVRLHTYDVKGPRP